MGVPSDARVLGVDACPAGWVGIAVGPAGIRAYVEELVADLVAAAALDGPLDAVGVDIPIGLMTDTPRQADLLAAARIGGLRSSVFTTPIRAALQATDHATASALNRDQAGFGVSDPGLRAGPAHLRGRGVVPLHRLDGPGGAPGGVVRRAGRGTAGGPQEQLGRRSSPSSVARCCGAGARGRSGTGGSGGQGRRRPGRRRGRLDRGSRLPLGRREPSRTHPRPPTTAGPPPSGCESGDAAC